MEESGLHMHKSFPVVKVAFRKVKDTWQEVGGATYLELGGPTTFLVTRKPTLRIQEKNVARR